MAWRRKMKSGMASAANTMWQYHQRNGENINQLASNGNQRNGVIKRGVMAKAGISAAIANNVIGGVMKSANGDMKWLVMKSGINQSQYQYRETSWQWQPVS